MSLKILILLVIILAATLVISQAQASLSSAKSDTIEYETLEIKDGFEIRKYPELTVASTELSRGSYSKNSSAGFRKIAAYIFGENSSNEKIAMTSPVQMDMGTDPTMSFFMPVMMDPKDLPVPDDNVVTVHIQSSKIVAVVTFSGWASDQVLKKYFEVLKSKLETESIEFEDSYSYLGYNPPYQLTHRKNEIIIPLINYKS